MSFDPSKPVQTRDGLPARILCTDRKSDNNQYPIVAAILQLRGTERIRSGYYPDGTLARDYNTPDDLVNTPKKHTIYVNVWKLKDPSSGLITTGFSEKERAAQQANSPALLNCFDLIARFEHTFVEGEGIT